VNTSQKKVLKLVGDLAKARDVINDGWRVQHLHMAEINLQQVKEQEIIEAILFVACRNKEIMEGVTDA
jgi:hypothetical protein